MKGIICYVCHGTFLEEMVEDHCMCLRCAPFCCQGCRGSISGLDYIHKVPRRREAVLATQEKLDV